MTNPAYEATNSDVDKLIADMNSAAKESKELSSIARYKKGIDAKAKFTAMATEENVLKLIAALERAQQDNKELVDDRTTSMNELSRIIQQETRAKRVAEKRIAELEAAPNGMMQLSNELAEMKRKCVELPDEFARIGENLRTQDNRITSHPVFVVFQKEEMVVSEEFDHDRIAWVWECGDVEVEDRTARRLEALHQGCRDTRGYSRYAMKSIKRFVTACFTEDGCKDYLRQNGHNLNEPFIYVHSAYRNDEWQVIRNWLMTVGDAVAGGE